MELHETAELLLETRFFFHERKMQKMKKQGDLYFLTNLIWIVFSFW
jgi:hypothetical protein